MRIDERTWWTRPGLEIRGGRLTIAGRDAEEVARASGTPVYVYDLPRIVEQATTLRDAMAGAGLRGLVRLALKAQRDPAVLAFLREHAPFVGLDVCSPGEIAWAREHGWSPAEISYTGTNLSDRDVAAILAAGVHLNVDLLSQLDRVGRAAPGSTVGLRVNPRIGASWGGSGETLYTGPRPTKFGLFAEQLDEALAIAARHDLTVDTVHVHVGDGYLTDQLPVFAETVRRVAGMVRTLVDAGCPIAEVNTGGGLGVPQRAGDAPLDVDVWAAILAEHLGGFDVVVATEPGDFLVKECGALLSEVVSVEEREGVRFVGLDAGWTVACERFVYASDLAIVLCRAAEGGGAAVPITLAGNINEGDDLFAEDLLLPEVREGDVVAMLGLGSYNASMYTEHCLRPPAGTVAFVERR
ncbi:MAG TPA: diaminopimelate decarboxylase [Actinomycetota bacterium]|nr:diaminopimelate decarboxylase [Actinomycetota bacterium]